MVVSRCYAAVNVPMVSVERHSSHAQRAGAWLFSTGFFRKPKSEPDRLDSVSVPMALFVARLRSM